MGMNRKILLLIITLALLPAVPLPVFADSPLVMGVFPRRDAAQTREMFRPMADHLAKKLKREVQLIVPPDFPAFWSRLADGEFDLVHYNQYHYIKAHKLFGHRAILMNEEHGKNSLYSVIMVNADSPFQSLQQLRGHKILFGGGKGAMVSYIMALDLLRQGGLGEADYISDIALNPVAATRALHYRQADASSGSDTLLSMSDMPWQNGNTPRVLAKSEPVAHLPWAVTTEVSEEIASQIRETLLALTQTAEGRRILSFAQLTALQPASDDDYAPHRAIVARALGEQY